MAVGSKMYCATTVFKREKFFWGVARRSCAGVVRDLRSYAGVARERGEVILTKTKMWGHHWMSADSCIFMGVH